MGKFDGVLLAADYDDTYYDRTFTVSPENRRAVESFMAQGGRFVVATGRSYINFAIQMEVEKPPLNGPVILTNGASIHDFSTGETLWEQTLPEGTSALLEEVCAAFPEVGFEAYHGDQVYTYRANTVTDRHLKRCQLAGIPSEISQMPTPWLKVILQHESTSYLHQVLDFIRARSEDYELTFSNSVLLEMTAKGANKGLCVKWLAHRLGIQPQHIYCVGNGGNDIPMLEVAAVPFAPDDCYPDVRAWGPVILPPCNDHCVARLIEILEERYA